METVTQDSLEGEFNYEHNIDLIEDYLSDCLLRGYSPETIRTHGSRLRTMASYLNKKRLTFKDVDKFVLRDILHHLRKEREIGFKTQKHYFSALSSFYRYLNFEEVHPINPVPAFKAHYLKRYKNNYAKSEYKLISVEDMAKMINSTINPRDKAVLTLFSKTGIRRGELLSIDIDDVNWENQSIKLKNKRKRSNKTVFFDDETAIILHRWLKTRENWLADPAEKALFIGDKGKRLNRHSVYALVRKRAQAVGLDDPDSDRLEDHVSPHCFRHWFTTNLRRNKMPREFIKELRGDSRKEAIDIYDHIDHEELRKAYLTAIPRLGIV